MVHGVKTGALRSGPWFALTLALPVAFAGAWAWLVPGGVVERLARSELQSAQQTLARAAAHLAGGLEVAAAAAPLRLRLDGERCVVGPFPEVTRIEPAIPELAERAAVARWQNGDIPAALPFFAAARDQGSLTPLGWLHFGEALAATNPRAALELLTAARARMGAMAGAPRPCAPLPFAVLALLAECRWQRAASDFAPVDAAAPSALAAMVPADLVATVCDALELDGGPHWRDALAPLRAAAAFALTGNSAPLAPTLGSDGVLLVPLRDAELAMVSARQVEVARAEAMAHGMSLASGLALRAGAVDPGIASLAIASLGETWTASPTSMPTSRVLAGVARSCLVLALLTLVIGNLLLWRLNRREAQLVKLRSDFVDVVSHELRTPLTALALKAENARCRRCARVPSRALFAGVAR
jgi:hypothetical protein